MNWYVLIGILVALLVLRTLRFHTLWWFIIWPVAVYCFIRLGISPHVPASVLRLYLALTMVGVTAYILADADRFRAVTGPLHRFIVTDKYRPLLYLVMILIPAAVAANVYLNMTKPLRASTFGRTIHPNPPNAISFRGKQIETGRGDNPFRKLETADPPKFREHVENGKRVYYQNCVFCHGDHLMGDGIFAHGLNPVPATFNSDTTIAMIHEPYLFWRIAKGGPGLPDESGPWESSMPAWEPFLTEDEIWEVILFLYEYIGRRPRAAEEH